MVVSASIFFHTCSFEWQVKGLHSRCSLTSERFALCGMQFYLVLQWHGGDTVLRVFLAYEGDAEIEIAGRILIQAYIKGRNGTLEFQQLTNTSDVCRLCPCIWRRRMNSSSDGTDKLSSDDDIVTFFFNFEYKGDHSDNFGREEKSVQTSLTVDPVPSFESLSVDLRRLLDGHEQTDVTLRCEDRTIAAHRVILSARSDVFSAMLSSDMSERREGVITIVDIDPPILEQLVQYIYSGSIPDLSADTAKRLYEAADKYAIESLKAQCSGFMKENLTEENACDVLAVADAHSDADLKECAVAFIVDSDLLLKEKWTNFCSEHSALAVEVYARAYAAKCSSNPVVPKVVPKDPRLYVYADLNRNRISPLQDNFLSCDNL